MYTPVQDSKEGNLRVDHQHLCLFITFREFSRQEQWSGLPFSPPVDDIFPVVMYRCELNAKELMFLSCGAGEDS